MADYSELKRKAQEIKDEVKAGANTANRVGLALEETVKALEAENKRAEQAEESLENAVQLLQDETEDLQSIRDDVERLGSDKADKSALEATDKEVAKKQNKLDNYKEDPSNGSVEIFAQDFVSMTNDSQGGVSCVEVYNEEDTEGIIPVARMSADKDNGDYASITIKGNEVHIDGDAVKVNGEDLESFRTTVVNNLTTGGADKALSAEMGKELAKEATTEHKGLMSAEDKRKIDEALGNVSKINFKGDEIGANNTYFDFSSPIPVKSGVTYRFSVDLNNPTSCSNYMWDGDTNLGYVFFNIGAKSFEFVPNIDGVVTRMSLRADNGIPFYAEGSISITIAEGNVAYKESIIQVNKDIQNIINKITVKYNILEGYYAGDTGKFHTSSTYVCTSLLPCVSGKTYHTPQAFRFTFYDESKSFISAVSPNIGEIPNNAKYVGITYTTTKWNKDEFYFYTDDLNDAIVYKSDLIATSAYYQEFKNNLINEPIEEIVESGEYGTTSAVYRIPVRCTGKYVIGIDFKFPSNFNASTDVLDIFSFGSVPNYTRLNGACKALITCAVATSEYQQPKCNGMVSVYTNTATSASVPIPSGRCEYKGGENDNAMPFGETAFSVRYTGESNTKTVTLDDTGLVVKNNGIVEVTIPYPTNKSLVDFANSIVSACDGTDFECNIYDVFAKSTDDLVRVSDIPLRYTYSYGEDAFPIFFKTIDKKWHRIEVVFDNDKVSGSKYMEMFVDGNPQKWSNIPALNLGTGVFDDYIVIGGNGVEVRNFSYKNNSTKISSPRIVVEMLHNIKNEVSSGAGGGESQNEGNLICAQEIEGIISTYQRNGYKHISLEEVMNYLNGNVELKGKFFCIIHDDDYFVANHPLVEKTYKRHGIKAAFAIINDFMSESEAEHFKKTGNLFQYTLHHQLGWASVPYSQLCEIMETDISALQDRLSTGTNMAIYPGGDHNLAVQEVLASYGLGYCGIVGSKTGTTSRANDKMAAPRMIRSLGKYDGLQAEIDTYSKFYD